MPINDSSPPIGGNIADSSVSAIVEDTAVVTANAEFESTSASSFFTSRASSTIVDDDADDKNKMS